MEVSLIIAENSPIQKDKCATYFGLGLQYYDEKNPIFDSVNQSNCISPNGLKIKSREQSSLDYIKINRLGRRLTYLFEKLSQ